MQLFLRHVNTLDGERYELVDSLEDTEIIESYKVGELAEAIADACFFLTGEGSK